MSQAPFKSSNYGDEYESNQHDAEDNNIPLHNSKLKHDDMVLLSKEKDPKKEMVSKKVNTNENPTYPNNYVAKPN